ncbi:MAG: hypothetical protein AMXMBFR47_44960 [Planctomycetota bacterium]
MATSVEQLFSAAREIPAGAARASYLDGACGGDAALRERVERLLKADADAGAFLTGNPLPRAAAAEPAADPVQIGERVGRYRLLRQIGEGGFGSVYLADQLEPVRRRVAFKVIKLGMDTRQVIGRFEAERQALALMDHPNIARVLDAGATDTGRPYFVMEYIEGVPILEYCDAEKLDTRQRLELFTKVCHAIQHAHQKGIIHRDIKPSNILVTRHDGLPAPKVIDFGIAKATSAELTARTLFTEHDQLIGTPVYMSPEQAEMTGDDIDTRSDIYSLGVLLYELLTGTTPFDTRELRSRGFAEMMRVIREVEPRKPSTRLSSLSRLGLQDAPRRHPMDCRKLIHTLKGDLDWIVMRCLEKDRTRRYETADGLAMDIRRYLGGEPVLAVPPTVAYRIRKFAQRNRGIVAAAVAVAGSLLIGSIAFAWQARIALEQRDRAERQLTRAEWLVYSGKLMLAQTDFEAGNGGLALHYLGECQPERRGWEWRYLSTRISPGLTLIGHGRDVSSAAFSPDGRRIVTGSEDGTAKVWDAATGQELLTLAGHAGLVLSVAYSPDGTRIVTGGGPWGQGENPGDVKVWDAATGRLLRELRGHLYCVWSVAFSPDGLRIVSGAGDWGHGPAEIKVWDAVTGQELLGATGAAGSGYSVAFSPDGKRIVSGDQAVRDAATGRELLSLYGHANFCRSVTFSPDGKRLAVGNLDGTVRIWDAGTGRELLVLAGHSRWLNRVAFSSDGARLATASADQTTKIWDATTGRDLLTLKGHAGHVRSVAFSPDGRRIVTAGNDRTAKVWDAEAGQEIPILRGHAEFISSVTFSPDAARVVTGSGDGTARVWDAATARTVLTLGQPTAAWSTAGLSSVAFSPDGRRIATGGRDQTARIWDASTGEMLLVLGHADVVSSVAFSPDGTRIVTGLGSSTARETRAGEVTLWDAATGAKLRTLTLSNVVSGVAFAPDGERLAAGGGDGTARVWDVATGRELLVLRGHSGELYSVAFSASGRRIVTGGRDMTARVWDAATGRPLSTLRGHTGAVRSAVFSPDDTRIVTGSDDRSVKVWEADTGTELLALGGHSDAVLCVAFSSDGQRLAAGIAGANAVAHVWYAAPMPAAQR